MIFFNRWARFFLIDRAVRSLQKASLGDGLATECKASFEISSRDAPIFGAEINRRYSVSCNFLKIDGQIFVYAETTN